MTKIYAPNKRYTGLIAGVSFVDGVGETDNKYLIGWFGEKGYYVELEITLIEDVEKAHSMAIDENFERNHPVDMEDLTVDKLKEIAKEIELKGYSKMNKQELVDSLNSIENPESIEEIKFLLIGE